MKPNKQMRKSIAAWKEKPIASKCSACSGSGYYDIKGSPKCRACDGSGLKVIAMQSYETSGLYSEMPY